MPTPENQAWRVSITKEITRLRKQFIFLFVLLVTASVLYGLKMYSTTSSIQALVTQIREDRYTSCETRREQLTTYNERVELSLIHILEAARIEDPNVTTRLKTQLSLDLQFPLPACPPDPSP